jgi:hypothetical protein
LDTRQIETGGGELAEASLAFYSFVNLFPERFMVDSYTSWAQVDSRSGHLQARNNLDLAAKAGFDQNRNSKRPETN